MDSDASERDSHEGSGCTYQFDRARVDNLVRDGSADSSHRVPGWTTNSRDPVGMENDAVVRIGWGVLMRGRGGGEGGVVVWGGVF